MKERYPIIVGVGGTCMHTTQTPVLVKWDGKAEKILGHFCEKQAQTEKSQRTILMYIVRDHDNVT